MPSLSEAVDEQHGTQHVPARPEGAVQSAVTDLLAAGPMAGLAVAVVRSTGVVLAEARGVADLRTQRPMSVRTVFPWFSMSKLVTATAVLRLADDGVLDLEAPVDVHLPWLPPRTGRAHPSTRALLTHTSGLRNPIPVRWAHAADRPAPSSRELLIRLLERRTAYRRTLDDRAAYTNVGYLLAGEVVAAASGMAFEDYVYRAVLDPIGMDATGFTYRPGVSAATGYVRAPRIADPVLNRLLPASVPAGRHGKLRALNPFYVDGPAYGGLIGDVLDAARFARFHLNDGNLDGHQVLSPGATREMRAVTHPGKPFDHGIGWFRRPADGAQEWVEHFGSGAGFWNVMRLYPARDLGVVVMANSTTEYDFEPLFSAVLRQHDGG